jgi:hypothetical protein
MKPVESYTQPDAPRHVRADLQFLPGKLNCQAQRRH